MSPTSAHAQHPETSAEEIPIDGVRVGAFRIPTDLPESDGTLEWNATTLVIVEVDAAGKAGLGYTYANAAAAELIRDPLAALLSGKDAFDCRARQREITARLRNEGRHGVASMAVSAVDAALWDLKSKHLGLSLAALLGGFREAMPVYGSGGFTSYTDRQLREQFEGWAACGITHFKMKIGRDPVRDPSRVAVARAAIGDSAVLMVDANGAYTPRQAIEAARIFAGDYGVRWLEEPVCPDDLAGLRFVREHVADGIDIAEGEYAYTPDDFRRLLEAGAADVVMADATRCGGVTGFLQAAALCDAWHAPLSSHCAPALHAAPACAVPGFRHGEYFHDHARIEARLFEGASAPIDGVIQPDRSRPGNGLEFKWSDAERYRI